MRITNCANFYAKRPRQIAERAMRSRAGVKYLTGIRNRKGQGPTNRSARRAPVSTATQKADRDVMPVTADFDHVPHSSIATTYWWMAPPAGQAWMPKFVRLK
jgi:hypothetical protein